MSSPGSSQANSSCPSPGAQQLQDLGTEHDSDPCTAILFRLVSHLDFIETSEWPCLKTDREFLQSLEAPLSASQLAQSLAIDNRFNNVENLSTRQGLPIEAVSGFSEAISVASWADKIEVLENFEDADTYRSFAEDFATAAEGGKQVDWDKMRSNPRYAKVCDKLDSRLSLEAGEAALNEFKQKTMSAASVHSDELTASGVLSLHPAFMKRCAQQVADINRYRRQTSDGAQSRTTGSDAATSAGDTGIPGGQQSVSKHSAKGFLSSIKKGMQSPSVIEEIFRSEEGKQTEQDG